MNKIKCEVKGYEDTEFEVGQQWKTRDGKVVEIEKVFDDAYISYPINITDGTSYTRNGREHKHRESNNDLVELVGVPVEEEVIEVIETYKDNADLLEYTDNYGLKVEENIEFYPIETSVEDKMVEILHQLLRQRDRDLEKISLAFNTFIEMEKMKK